MREEQLNIEYHDTLQHSLRARYEADLAELNAKYRDERKARSETLLRDVDAALSEIKEASPASSPYLEMLRDTFVEGLDNIG
ncbi:hypothetical protein [Rudaeicoccus suwonensis]|uniref:Uncharacterized protein n=1 Tax=Rudaeicoccus suwonensis TaxID=657409 RepID=A0A561EAE6_9MICO|nr:hypothetical protein [Rudaeicoccus suwonensis]TWE12581.1 hypothetical protein BKA23_1394 [Rudaeicoccus suwonensis]